MKKSKLSKFQSERLYLNKAQKLVGGAIEVTIKTDSNKKEAPKEELVQIVINMEESDRFTINI